MKTLLFDFDGVILDSIPVKTEAFRRLFEGHPDAAIEAFVRFHLRNGGLSRYFKIRHFHETLLGRSVPDAEIMRLAARFSDLVQDELSQPRYLIPDTRAFLESHAREFPCHVVSGADERELKEICASLGISSHFRSIRGSPTPKAQLVGEVLAGEGCPAADAVMIGDSINDLQAARLHGVRFFGYNNPELKEIPGSFYLETMAELLPQL